MAETEVYKQRQRIKKLIELYKLQAGVMGYSGIGTVYPMDAGAFVEVQIWIPLERVEPSGSGRTVGGPERPLVGDAGAEGVGGHQP